MYYVIVFSISILINFISAEQQHNCGEWDFFNDEKCYKVIKELKSFDDAKTACFDMNESSLVSIRSQQEQDSVFRLLKDNHNILDSVWIGIEYSISEYKWTDSSALNYTNWANGFPVNESGYDCVQMTIMQPFNGKWFNIQCKTQNVFVCERPQIWKISFLQKTLMELRKYVSDEFNSVSEELLSVTEKLLSIENKLYKLEQEVTPTGTIAYFTNTTVPIGWLKANGQSVSRILYQQLFSTIGTSFGSGDGITTFLLPDLRGEFIRGWNDGRDVDKNRGFGSFQWGSSIPMAGYIDRIASFTYQPAYQDRWGFAGKSFDGGFEGNVPSGETRNDIIFPNDNVGNLVASASMNNYKQSYITTWNIYKGTRPRNIALLACIKY